MQTGPVSSKTTTPPAPATLRRWISNGRRMAGAQEIFIVQARPETVQSRKHWGSFDTYELKQKGKVLLTGRSVGDRIGQGPVRVIKNISSLHTL